MSKLEKSSVNTEETKVTQMANLKLLADEKERREGKAPKISKSTHDILKCIIVLTLIAVVSGGVLGVFNYITYVDADAAIVTEIGSYFSLSNDYVKKYYPVEPMAPEGAKSYIKACFIVVENPEDINSVSAVVYHAVGSGAYSGTVELLVYVQNDKISNITVYAQSETNGIGTKALESSYLAKYKDINLKEIEGFVRSTDETTQSNIKFISGATKTSKAVNNALNAVVYAYKKNYGGDAL